MRKHEKATCPCGGALRISRYDLALAEQGPESERLYFGIAGGLCLGCGSLALDRDTKIVLGIGIGTAMSLIESDVVLGRDLSA